MMRCTSVTQLASISCSPAGDLTVVKNDAGMAISSRDCNCSCSSSKTRCLSRCEPVRSCPISELTIPILSPTTYRTIIKNGAGVGTSSRECDRCTTYSKAAGQGGGWILIRCISGAQLAIGIPTPTTYRTIIKNCAGIFVTRRESDRGTTRSEGVGQGGYVTVRCASAAQLAFAVLPPTGYCTNVQDGAGMIVTRRESDCGTTRSKAVG